MEKEENPEENELLKFLNEKREYVENYFMLDGKKVPMSEETAESLRGKQYPIIKRLLERLGGSRQNNGLYVLFTKPKTGKVIMAPEKATYKPGHHSTSWVEDYFEKTDYIIGE